MSKEMSKWSQQRGAVVAVTVEGNCSNQCEMAVVWRWQALGMESVLDLHDCVLVRVVVFSEDVLALFSCFTPAACSAMFGMLCVERERVTD